ncbi:MAG: protein kinase, partial [Planctomycetes bacterium]|nr:protein kinase [Planctomycetota bacterium]
AEDPRARARFVDEAQITGQLEHPNIVPVYDVGERDDDRRPFYTMRFVRGPTLADAIRDDVEATAGARAWPRSRQRLVRALCSIGNAISHAHSRGIIHRDLKPENIILGPHGELILLDWGLAKRIQQETPELHNECPPRLDGTNVGAVMGTIAYMSPEQAAGQRPDERTDIYGLGAILYEVLTGRPPHSGDEPLAVLRAIVERDVTPPRTLQPLVPAALQAICVKAMARRPEDRFATAAAFVQELERYLADDPVEVLPDTLPAALARWVRRHQGLAYAGAAAILLVSIIATIAAIQLGAAADRERGLRERSIGTSARLAARALGSEMDLRWGALGTAARSEQLRRRLRAGGSDPAALQAWIEARAAAHAATVNAVSWFVQDRGGVQRARAPFSPTSVGKSYAFRDYFHGRGQDLPQDTTDVEPITEPHLSRVFRSQVTDNLMVAFTVPVFDADDARDAEVLGVVGMTVELERGMFQCLKELGLDDNQIAVLVETREDWTGRPGLVLQHPELGHLRDGGGAERARTAHVPAEHVRHFVERGHGILRGYRDALGDDVTRCIAAFDTVRAHGYGVGNTSWVVIIQERDGA